MLQAQKSRLKEDQPLPDDLTQQAVESIAPKIGCNPVTLLEWVKRAEIDSGRLFSRMLMMLSSADSQAKHLRGLRARGRKALKHPKPPQVLWCVPAHLMSQIR